MADTEMRVANPGPTGLVAFGMTTIMLSLVNAGLLPAGGEPVVIPLAISLGGLNQLIAGALEFRAGNSFGMTAFLSYGAFWLWFAMLYLFGHHNIIDLGGAGPTVGVALILWGIVTIGFWVCTFRLSLVLWLTFLCLIAAFFLLGLAGVLHRPALDSLGGWAGLVTGALALYCGIAQLANGMSARPVFPLGAPLAAG